MTQFIKIENQKLFQPLSKVLGVVEAKNTLSILANVLLIKKDGELSITAANDSIQITTYADAVVDTTDGNEAITINAKKLSTLLKNFPLNADVSFKLDNDNDKVIINCSRSRFNLQTLPAEDYPNLEDDDEVIGTFTIPQMEFKKLLKHTSFAMGDKDIRYYLNGLYLDIEPHKIIAVATNGHRMSYAAQTFENELPTSSVIIPRNTILELIRLLPDSISDLDISIRKHSVKFEFNGITLIAKLIDGNYPAYSSLFEGDFNSVCKASKDEIIEAIKRVIIVGTNGNDQGVSFNFSNNNLKISVENYDGEVANAEVPISYYGEPLEIGFNCSYILEKLQSLTDDVVLFRFIDQNTSALISGFNSYVLDENNLKQIPLEVNGDDKSVDYNEDGDFITNFYEKYIVMPVRI